MDSLFKVLLTTSQVRIIFLNLGARIQLFRKCIVYHFYKLYKYAKACFYVYFNFSDQNAQQKT